MGCPSQALAPLLPNWTGGPSAGQLTFPIWRSMPAAPSLGPHARHCKPPSRIGPYTNTRSLWLPKLVVEKSAPWEEGRAGGVLASRWLDEAREGSDIDYRKGRGGECPFLPAAASLRIVAPDLSRQKPLFRLVRSVGVSLFVDERTTCSRNFSRDH
jgi:hypothetical protein